MRAAQLLKSRALAVEVALSVAIFALALSVYNATLTPSLSYESLDGNELATIPYQLGLAHSTGYPLYTWVGKLFTLLPVGDVAHRVNLMSAAGAAGGAALLFAAAVIVMRGPSDASQGTRKRWMIISASAVGALLLAFSTTLWSQAVIAEVYAPNIFMVGLTFLLLLLWARREEARSNPRSADARSLALFGAFALSFALSTGMHMSNLSFAPAFVLFILLTNWRVILQPKVMAVGLIGFGLGALQYAWLPYKAGDPGNAVVGFSTPNDLEGIYNYTLNAFPQFRWAFPLDAIPERIVLYFELVLANFGWHGAALALVGAWGMVIRRPKAFLLFITAYVTEMVFFLEYAAPDIEVFFIPAHYILAIGIAYGALVCIEAAAALARRVMLRPPFAAGAAVAVIGLAPFFSLGFYWDDNDQSANTSVNDFYDVVFATLPADSVLLGQAGVFGYDMFYFRYVYDVRPDVIMPLADGDRNVDVTGRRTFTTTRGGGFLGRGGGRRVGGQSDAWYWPVVAAPSTGATAGLFAIGSLTLYEEKADPPALFTSVAAPASLVDEDLSGLRLVGYDLERAEVATGEAVHLTLFWEGDWSGSYTVSTKLGETDFVESHQLGFGNLSRYIQSEGDAPAGSLLLEEYDLVVLSNVSAGEQMLSVQVASGQETSDWLDLNALVVTN